MGIQSGYINQGERFRMPGGKIVVYEGLMNLVSSDDELAVVIGHEAAARCGQA